MNLKKKRIILLPATGEIVSLAGAREDDKSNLSVTEYRKLSGLLHQPVTSLGESDLTTVHILNLLNLNPSSPHLLL